jgi:hypothetical protein
MDLGRTLRGALAGAAAAGVWAAQQPLDKRVFGVEYDDVELLGRVVVRGDGWYPAGLAMHCLNGAVFGAAYAQVNRSLPGPAVARGVAAGLAENIATWPATRLVGTLHPQGDAFPRLWGDHRAFAQATWRHALFGAVLGAIEARLNPPTELPPPDVADVAESNGHGDVHRLVSVGPAA